MTLGLINANPVVHAKKERVARTEDPHADDAVDPLEIYAKFKWVLKESDEVEIFDSESANHVRDIRDPEHPYSLEQLSVLSEESITVDEKLGRILIMFTPTIQHCSMVTVIGLCLREKLKDCFPPHFKYQLLGNLHRMHQKTGQSINDFLSIMNGIWDQLALSEPQWEAASDACKFAEYRDRIRDMQFLMALNDEFEYVRASLLHQDPLPCLEVDIKVAPGSHADEESVNKQLNDKERVAAALENPNLRQLVDECLYSSEL